jgi:hypothetical protein
MNVKIAKQAALAAVALLAGFAPHARTAPARWALIVGVSDYINFGAEIGGDLPGARNDAIGFRDVLVARYGFTESNIHLVLDREATRARLERELKEWLPSVVKPGDLVVFFFAGHGSQAWDTNGDEEDGLDETICPTDVVKGNTDKDIPDDELNRLLGGIPTDNIAVVLDNCHAGSGTRAVTPFARPRALARNAAVDVPKPANATFGQPARNTALDKLPGKILEIAAAQADEVAVDAEWPGQAGEPSRFGGAFTTNLVKNLWQAPEGTSYSEIFELTVEDLKRERFAQRPNISRAEPHPAFQPFGESAKSNTSGPFVPVAAANGAQVELAGGTAAGMTVGSVYEVGAARLRVTTVEPNRALAQAEGGSVQAGDRAKLVEFMYPEVNLRVSIADVARAARAGLASELARIPGVTVVQQPREFAHLLVRPGAKGGYMVIGLDGATRHSVGANAVGELIRTIEQESSAHQLASLENPARPFNLVFGFSANKSTFRLGETIGFRAQSFRNGYLTIVDLGTDGKVTVLYPLEAEQDSRVDPDRTIVIPTAAMAETFQAQEPVGRGLVRAFVTERPLNLAFKAGAASQAAQVAAALRAAVGAEDGNAAVPVGTWATASVVYTITK